METIKVIDNAMGVLGPLIGMLELHALSGKPNFSDIHLDYWADEILITYGKQVFSVGWLDVKKFGKNAFSMSNFEYHKKGDQYFINLFSSPEATLFIPVIEVDTENSIINHQIVKLSPGQACIMPAGVIHAPPVQNQREKGVMLVFNKYNLDSVSVLPKDCFQFEMEV